MSLRFRVGLNESMGLMPYNSAFRYQRKIIAREIGNKKVASNYDEWMELEASRLLLRVLENPDDIFDHIEKSVS